ncbi:sulfite exporter TauE/SafE family protein [Methylocella sp. CPCC 101449]|uniref:sulfite exporter TauE/SafE family protein n=1 Tax=Methylocella sp. CPCC 101449 TaxID=2987531 RepID=UPI00289200C7|nr:sulfite exporter TauE/SafE family protein [Methylocella sp. CPCC 101449]MDT2020763.1 sulfite exporter TauE/SafE family protein [Methylocella sp. CPCC 101449]
MTTYLLLCAAGFLAGAMNALAGGGSFVTLPALIAAGVPSVAANASSTVALWPGGVASVWVYRDGLGQVAGVPLLPTWLATLIGGAIGALLLLWTPTSLFDHVLPWLLLVATLMLTFGPRLGPLLRRHFSAGIVTVLSIQLILGIYGGYFGGAVGLMMLAAWSLLDTADIKTLNPSRALMTTSANTIAMVIFAFSGIVYWPEMTAMAIGALAGGYGGAHLGRRLPPQIVRGGTILFACAVTAVFFLRAYR